MAASSRATSTDSTSGESVTIVIRMSDASATACGDAPEDAPNAVQASMPGCDRFQTIGTKPALIRFATIGTPMIPRPINPMRSMTHSLA